MKEEVEILASWTVTEVLAFFCLLLLAALVFVAQFLFRRNQKLTQTLLETQELRLDCARVIQESVVEMRNGFDVLNRELKLRMEALEKVIEGCHGRSSGGPTRG
jgi:hypothetical protein